MIRTIKISIAVVAALVLGTGCVSFQEIQLDPYSQAAPTVGKSALTYKRGDLLRFDNWQASSQGIKPSVNGGVLTLDVNGVRREAAVVKAVSNSLDFRGDLALKVRARSQGNEEPLLTFRFVDKNGLMGAERKLESSIHVGSDFRNYYFPLNGSLVQTNPEYVELDAANIRGVVLMVNQRGKPYTGKIEIEGMNVILGKEIIAGGALTEEGVGEGVVDGFAKDLGWKFDKGLEATFTGEGVKIDADNVGSMYEGFERKIETISLAGNKKLKVRAKCTGAQPARLRFDVVDSKGLVSNYLPIYVKVENTGEYADYIFDFKGRFRQSYPVAVEIDPARLVKLVGYINAGWTSFTGSVEIDSIEIVD